MIEKQLELLTKEINTLKQKITQKLQTNQQTQTKLNETNHKLELTSKENSENEKVLEQLLKEFKELEKQID